MALLNTNPSLNVRGSQCRRGHGPTCAHVLSKRCVFSLPTWPLCCCVLLTKDACGWGWGMETQKRSKAAVAPGTFRIRSGQLCTQRCNLPEIAWRTDPWSHRHDVLKELKGLDSDTHPFIYP